MLSPVVFRLSVASQLKAELILLIRERLSVPPLQIVALVPLIITGEGLTETTTVCAAPEQLPAVDVGVTV